MDPRKMDQTAVRRDWSRPWPVRDRRSEAVSIVQHAQEVQIWLTERGGDLRTVGSDDRRQFGAQAAELGQRLSRQRALDFDPEQLMIIVKVTTAVASAMVPDRAEHEARKLIQCSRWHLPSVRHHLPQKSRPEVLKAWRVRAEVCSELGEHDRSERLLRMLAEDECGEFGVADPQTRLLLGWELAGQGRLPEAKEELTALTSHLADAADAHELLQHARCRGAWLLWLLGRPEESVRAYAHVIDGRVRGLGMHHPDTLDAQHSQIKVLLLAGEVERALVLLKSLLAIRTRVQGERHPDTLETWKFRRIAQAQIDLRDDRVVGQARRDLAGILDLQTRRLGSAHPMTRDTARWRNWLDHVREANRFRCELPPPPSV
jgi:hypothetical protein